MASSALPPPVSGRKPTTIDLVGGIFCHICKTVLCNKKEFDSHYLKHNTGTEVITYTCVACHLTSPSYPSFRGHCYTYHVMKDKFRCDNCNKTFSKPAALKEHIELIHNFKCNKPECNKQFPSKKELHLHQILHKDEANQPPYQCQTCGEEFENINSCEDHIDKHCIFTYSCPICHDELNKENANQHLTNHYDETNDAAVLKVEEIPEDSSINIIGGISCRLCEILFKNRLEIDTHFAEVHPDEEIMYTCIICHKSLEKYSLFGDHCYNHYSKNKFACDVCDKTFSRLSLLVVHAEVHSVDENDKKYRCRQCNLPLRALAAARRHLPVHRRTTYKCPVCARSYAEKYLIMKHAPQHFEAVFHMCKVCGKVFAAKSRLIEHTKIHSKVKSYACKYCDKMFMKSYQLSQHVNVHTGAKPYTCVSCPKTFASMPNRQKHVRRMHNIDPKTLNRPAQYDLKKPDRGSLLKPEPKAEILKVNAEETKETYVFYDEFVETDSIDATVVEREARKFELTSEQHMNTDNETELTPILSEDIDKFISEMLSSVPCNAPDEYGPDFAPDAPLPHVAPQLVAAPSQIAPWEPVITKVCGSYYQDLDLSFIDTDIF